MSSCKACMNHRNNIADARKDVVQALRRMERLNTGDNLNALTLARAKLAEKKADAAAHALAHEAGTAT